jgi:hypothetical protein
MTVGLEVQRPQWRQVGNVTQEEPVQRQEWVGNLKRVQVWIVLLE